jgi:uncharacterized protein
MDREAFLQWFSGVPDHLFSQIAAQVLFLCESCTECCRGEGYALVDDEDIGRIADALGISRSQATARFTQPDPGKNRGCTILKSTGTEKSCCLLDTKTGNCKVYENRPGICRSFPMLVSEPQADEAICFYDDCRGTASFARMIQKMSLEPEVQKDVRLLCEQEGRQEDLRISLYIWLCRLLGKEAEADHICRITGLQFQEESAFKRDCLSYFLMTMRTDAIKEYLKACSKAKPSERDQL